MRAAMDLARLSRIDDWTWAVPRAAGEARARSAALRQPRRCSRRWTTRCSSRSPTSRGCPASSARRTRCPTRTGATASRSAASRRSTPSTAASSAPAASASTSRAASAACAPTSRSPTSRRTRRCSATRCCASIPAGVGVEGAIRSTTGELDAVLRGGARWAVEHGYGVAEDLAFIEEHGRIDGALPGNVSSLAKKRQRGEMGTLGSGNHYLELQRVERVFDERAAAAYGLFARPGPRVDPLRLARARAPDRHRVPGEPGQGRVAPRDRAARPRARVRADPLARGRRSTSAR